MNNDTKMRIKRIPILYSLGKPLYKVVNTIHDYPSNKEAGRRLITELNSLAPGVPRVWYFGIPTHNNLGDQAQKFCILKWLEETYPDREIVCISSKAFNTSKRVILKLLKSLIQIDDYIVMQSGYTMDGIHPDEIAHSIIPRVFPDNKVIFFPQTILYRSKKGQRRDQAAFEANKHILLMARDDVSFKTASEIFPGTRVVLFPDIVTSMIGRYHYEGVRKGILVCARNDGEKFYDSSQIGNLVRSLQRLDDVDVSDTTVNLENADLSSPQVWKQIESVFLDYSKYLLVVTDRYHGTIFSLIAGTPVVVMKTTDHKVVAGANWFSGICDDYIQVAEDINLVYGIAEKILDKELTYDFKVGFDKKYYDGTLKAIIDSL